MCERHDLSGDQIAEIGQVLYGLAWQGPMAKAIGVPRQSISYYLKSGGASRTQAAAIIGLVARIAVHEQIKAKEDQATNEARQAILADLLHRLGAF